MRLKEIYCNSVKINGPQQCQGGASEYAPSTTTYTATRKSLEHVSLHTVGFSASSSLAVRIIIGCIVLLLRQPLQHRLRHRDWGALIVAPLGPVTSRPPRQSRVVIFQQPVPSISRFCLDEPALTVPWAFYTRLKMSSAMRQDSAYSIENLSILNLVLLSVIAYFSYSYIRSVAVYRVCTSCYAEALQYPNSSGL